MKVAVIDYGMGNLHSVSKALETVGAEVSVTADPSDLKSAERIVLPGVGSFSQGMQHLTELKLIPALQEEVVLKKKPFLGICLGMQLMAKTGHEHGISQGLGWLNAEVVGLDTQAKGVKVPHMGWNDVHIIKETPLFKGVKDLSTFYFVHSYHMVPQESDFIVGTCDYGGPFVAAMSMDNIHLVQFHPEKSQDKGLQVLENFCSF